jgi:hypothetical protein
MKEIMALYKKIQVKLDSKKDLRESLQEEFKQLVLSLNDNDWDLLILYLNEMYPSFENTSMSDFIDSRSLEETEMLISKICKWFPGVYLRKTLKDIRQEIGI